MKSKLVLRASIATLLAAGCCVASSAFAGDKPKGLMLFSYLGDQAYVRQYNVAKGRAGKIEDVQIDVKSGTSRGDVNFFIQEIVNAPAEGYKVIGVNTGATSKELVSALNDATKQGIKVLSFDGAPPPIDDLTAQVNYDPVGAEKAVVQEFAKQLPAGGEIGVIRCIAGLADTDAFINAFKDALKGTKFSIVAEGDARCDPEKSRTIAEGMLNAHPNLVGIYDIFDVSAQGTLQALEAAGSNVIVGSVGGQEYALKAIAAGNKNWKFTVPYPFEVIARTATDTTADLVRGKSVEKLVVVPAQPVQTSENAGGMLKTVSDVVAGNVDDVVK
ncbi:MULTISPECIES: sugar ABC transporter substrate-binding protein [Mesorhizobium]|uniref:sugar ABC transporter substrate-binding protein n=1 Tax=Mesorhizobium TaxID=68287 RepID=UPI0010A961F7|nr:MULTISPECIES: sugar ABC transporter substrate-binding protein [Mesorhizobium]